MKRKMIVLLLAFIVAFSLCACGDSVDIQQSVSEGQEKLASVENCAMVLRITINPQLELYLDNGGTVLKSVACNDDGEQLLAAKDLTGLGYTDAMNAILSGAEKQGFLSNKAEVQIEVLSSANGPLTFEQTQQMNQTVKDYNQDLVSSVDQTVVVAQDSDATSVVVEEFDNGDLFYSYYVGQEVVREICYGVDGSYTEWVYENRNTVKTIHIFPNGDHREEYFTYHSNGQLSTWKMFFTDATGTQESLEEYWENGNMKSNQMLSITDAQTEKFFEEYDENGTLRSVQHVVIGDTGTEEILEEYDENGTLRSKRHIMNHDTGTEEILEEYDENGTLRSVQHVMNYDTGTYNTREEYYENGNLNTRTIVWTEGTASGESFEEYAENGTPKLFTARWIEGTVVSESREEFYDNGVSRIATLSLVDGTYLEESLQEHYENGNPKREWRIKSDGTVSEENTREYAENGNITKAQMVRSNGDTRLEEYDENGNLLHMTIFENGRYSETKCSYHANGTIKTREYTSTDGEAGFEEFYESGMVKTMKTIWANGEIYEDQYDEMGNYLYQYMLKDGDSEETRYTRYPDGAVQSMHKIVTRGTDASETYEEYYESGKTKLRRNSWSDGTVGEVHFDENGNRTWLLETNGDNRQEVTYYPNGNPKTVEEIFPDSTVYVYRLTTYAEDGSHHMIEELPDGTVREYDYDKYGQPI